MRMRKRIRLAGAGAGGSEGEDVMRLTKPYEIVRTIYEIPWEL